MRVPRLRINEQVRASRVYVLSEQGLKEMSCKEALRLARERHMDLIEILQEAPERPALCRVTRLEEYKAEVRKFASDPKKAKAVARAVLAAQAKLQALLDTLLPKRRSKYWTDLESGR